MVLGFGLDHQIVTDHDGAILQPSRRFAPHLDPGFLGGWRTPDGIEFLRLLSAEYGFIAAGPGAIRDHHEQPCPLCPVDHFRQVLEHPRIETVPRLLGEDPGMGDIDIVGSPRARRSKSCWL